jgi:S-formylglutathione hydrolase FrmB
MSLILILCASLAAAPDEISITPAVKDPDGFLVHEVRSPFQAGVTQIRLLPPEALESGQKYPIIYVLPVEASRESRYGDGLKEIKQLKLHNQRKSIFVAPTFSQLPWYADHPTNPEIRQESYFLKAVVPWIDQNYPVRAEADGRMLLGFSKSGWGAFSLLLRHPDLFGKAAAWDAPLMMDQPGKYGNGPIFGTQANFESYRLDKLLEQQAGQFQTRKRLVLLGYDAFRQEHSQAHELMERLKIVHAHRDGPTRKHDWHSGWVAEAVELLLSDE